MQSAGHGRQVLLPTALIIIPRTLQALITVLIPILLILPALTVRILTVPILLILPAPTKWSLC